MKLVRTALMMAMGFSCAAPLVRADEPKKDDATVKPATPAAPAKPAPAKDEPSVPSIKGAPGPNNGFLKRHEGFLKDKEMLLAKGPIQFLLVGDSITDGWRGGKGKEVFESAFGQYNPYNIGIGGDRTQHVLWRLENGEVDGIKPKVAMLMIGTNNTGSSSAEDIAAGVTKCVQLLRTKLPDTKVLLLGVFPRAEKPENPARAKIKSINEIIQKLDDGGKTVKYLDITDKFLDKDGTLPKDIMPDFLHPNAKGYQIWADAVKPTLDEMMK
jgi:lysophospholipase L1-like esterase